MNDHKHSEGDQDEEVNRPCALSTAKQFCVQRPSVMNRRRHSESGQDRQWRENENRRAIRELLERIVNVKPVRLWRKMERRVIDEDFPTVRECSSRSRYQSLPAAAR